MKSRRSFVSPLPGLHKKLTTREPLWERHIRQAEEGTCMENRRGEKERRGEKRGEKRREERRGGKRREERNRKKKILNRSIESRRMKITTALRWEFQDDMRERVLCVMCCA